MGHICNIIVTPTSLSSCGKTLLSIISISASKLTNYFLVASKCQEKCAPRVMGVVSQHLTASAT